MNLGMAEFLPIHQIIRIFICGSGKQCAELRRGKPRAPLGPREIVLQKKALGSLVYTVSLSLNSKEETESTGRRGESSSIALVRK